jgi:hypothetical protein
MKLKIPNGFPTAKEMDELMLHKAEMVLSGVRCILKNAEAGGNIPVTVITKKLADEFRETLSYREEHENVLPKKYLAWHMAINKEIQFLLQKIHKIKLKRMGNE